MTGDVFRYLFRDTQKAMTEYVTTYLLPYNISLPLALEWMGAISAEVQFDWLSFSFSLLSLSNSLFSLFLILSSLFLILSSLFSFLSSYFLSLSFVINISLLNSSHSSHTHTHVLPFDSQYESEFSSHTPSSLFPSPSPNSPNVVFESLENLSLSFDAYGVTAAAYLTR